MQCDIPGEGQPQLDPVQSHLTQVIPPQTQDQALLISCIPVEHVP